MNKNWSLSIMISITVVLMLASLGGAAYLYFITDDRVGDGPIISGLTTIFTGFSAILTVLAMLKGKLSQQVWEAFGLMQECNSKIRRLQTTVRNIENMGINKFPDMRDREVISQITLSLDIDAQEWKSMQFIKNGDELRVLISGLQKQINQYNSNLLTPHWHQTKRDPTEELKEISRKAEIAENHISKIKPKQDSLWKTMFGSNRKATCSLEEDYNQAVNSMD